MSAANLLTQEEVEALTGAKQAAKQASILDEHGIYYIRRVDGKIITTWHHVNHPCQRSVANDSEPNFAAMG